MNNTRIKVGVTGASGFIGRALVKNLLTHGYQVKAVTRKDPSQPPFTFPNLEWIHGDCTQESSLNQAFMNCDAVCHSGGLISFSRKDLPLLDQVNVRGTLNVVNACERNNVKKLVFVSAAATVGFTKDKHTSLNEDHTFEPDQGLAYALSKKKAEEAVKRASGNGLTGVIVNPCTVYGPGDHSLNSGAVIRDVLSGSLRLAPPGGTTVVAVEDVAAGIRLAMEQGKEGERYILANEQMEFTELLSTIARVAGVEPIRRKIPRAFYYPGIALASLLELGRTSRITREMVSSLFFYKYYDSSKARKELGWSPSIPFPESVRLALDYYRQNKLL